MFKLFRLQLLWSITLIAFYAGTNELVLCATRLSADECPEVAPWIPKLRSADQRKRQRAKESILTFSSRSPNSRQCVIKPMQKIVDEIVASPDGGFLLAAKYPERYAEWIEATDILGTMKATEAMDSLIECLDYNNGTTDFGIGHFPATKAIVKFGDQAIPKLEGALQQKPPGIRVMAAQALHAIGGEKAKSILEETLKTEKDEGVATRIRNMLIGWTSSGKPQPWTGILKRINTVLVCRYRDPRRSAERCL